MDISNRVLQFETRGFPYFKESSDSSVLCSDKEMSQVQDRCSHFPRLTGGLLLSSLGDKSSGYGELDLLRFSLDLPQINYSSEFDVEQERDGLLSQLPTNPKRNLSCIYVADQLDLQQNTFHMKDIRTVYSKACEPGNFAKSKRTKQPPGLNNLLPADITNQSLPKKQLELHDMHQDDYTCKYFTTQSSNIDIKLLQEYSTCKGLPTLTHFSKNPSQTSTSPSNCKSVEHYTHCSSFSHLHKLPDLELSPKSSPCMRKSAGLSSAPVGYFSQNVSLVLDKPLSPSASSRPPIPPNSQSYVKTNTPEEIDPHFSGTIPPNKFSSAFHQELPDSKSYVNLSSKDKLNKVSIDKINDQVDLFSSYCRDIPLHHFDTQHLVTNLQKSVACKSKGQKRSRRHVPHSERSAAAVAKRNRRERCRIGGVNQAFEILRQHTPSLSHLERAPKISILRQAVSYIRELAACLSTEQKLQFS